MAIEPSLVANDADLLVRLALEGAGLAYILEEQLTDELASGALIQVLEGWSVPFAGSHLYFPSRRQMKPALRALIDALKQPGRGPTG